MDHTSDIIDSKFVLLNEVLNAWDPLGVLNWQRQESIPLDEYYSYAVEIYGMLTKGADVVQLAEYLANVVEQMMLEDINPRRERNIAHLIFWLYEQGMIK